jgi:hypothetical protein
MCSSHGTVVVVGVSRWSWGRMRPVALTVGKSSPSRHQASDCRTLALLILTSPSRWPTRRSKCRGPDHQTAHGGVEMAHRYDLKEFTVGQPVVFFEITGKVCQDPVPARHFDPGR